MSAHPYESWMGACSGTKKLTPRQFCFPGTHDTGAYQTPDFNPIASNEAMARSVERFAPGYQEVATRWAVSQPGYRVYDQLMNGVRFLDLRCSYAKDETGTMTYFLIHTFVVCKLATVLAEVKTFLSVHPSEMVMMAFYPYYNISPGLLQDYVEGEMREFMLEDKTATGAITDTVDSILKQGKQLIAVWGGPRSQRINALFFAVEDMIYSFPFLSVDNVPQKQAYIMSNLHNYLNTEKGKTLFQLTYTLTEVPIDVARSIFAGGSLKQFADIMNPTQLEFVNKLTPEERSVINIITNDDQASCQNVSIAITLIAERAAKIPVLYRPVAPPTAMAVAALPPHSEKSAWDVHRHQSPPTDHCAGSRRHCSPGKERASCWRYLCCCFCCDKTSVSEDEVPFSVA